MQLMDRNPEFAQVLNNPQQLQEAMQAASNPVSHDALTMCPFCWMLGNSRLLLPMIVLPLSVPVSFCTQCCSLLPDAALPVRQLSMKEATGWFRSSISISSKTQFISQL